MDNVGHLVGTVIAVIVLEAGFHTVAAVLGVPEIQDERDAAVELRGSRAGHVVMAYGAVMLTGHVLLTTVYKPEHVLTPVQIANVLLGIFILAGCVSFAVQLRAYRTGL